MVMGKLLKKMLKVGKYRSPDGVVDVTADRLHHWHSVFKKMTAAGHTIPVRFDHATDMDGTVPLSAIDYDKQLGTKHTVGKLADIRLSGDKALVVLDLPNQEAYEKAKDNLVGLSPVVMEEWTDGDFTTWKDSITHMDLVDHPVDHKQEPFVQPGALAMSLKLGKKSKLYRMGADDAPPPKNDEEKDPPKKPAKSEGDDEGEGDGEGASYLTEVIDALSKKKIILPPDTTEDNFLDRLHTALLTSIAHNGEDEDEELDMGAGEGAPPPMMMAAIKMRRREIERDLDELARTGRATPAEIKTKKESLGQARMSIDNEGNFKRTKVETFIEDRKDVPEGTFWTDKQRATSKRMAAHAPADFGAPHSPLESEPTHEEAEAFVDKLFGKKK
jgi:hypothetical protein